MGRKYKIETRRHRILWNFVLVGFLTFCFIRMSSGKYETLSEIDFRGRENYFAENRAQF